MNKIIPFLVGGFLLVGAVGCQQGTNNADSTGTTSTSSVNQVKTTADKTGDAAKTAADKTGDATKTAADKTGSAAKTATDKTATTVKSAADGGKTTVQNSGVETIVANRLKEKFPNSQLQVNKKDGVLIISGVVPNEETLKKIAPTVKEYKFQDIKDIKVEAKVANQKPQ